MNPVQKYNNQKINKKGMIKMKILNKSIKNQKITILKFRNKLVKIFHVKSFVKYNKMNQVRLRFHQI